MKRARVSANLSDAEDSILSLMHQEFVTDKDFRHTVSSLKKQLPLIASTVINLCLESLQENLFIKKEMYEYTHPLAAIQILGTGKRTYAAYNITREGTHEVEGWSNERYDRVNFYIEEVSKSKNADDELLQTDLSEIDSNGEGSSSVNIEVPAADRIVGLNHNSDEYREVTSSLDDVIREFREDHHLDNELGAEKGALLKALEGGRELLNDARVRVDTALALIVQPLRILIARYDQALVGALATTALAVVMKILGLM